MLNLIYNKEYSNDRQLVNTKKKNSKEFTSFWFNGSHGKMANAELSNVFCGILVRLLKCFDQWFLFSF